MQKSDGSLFYYNFVLKKTTLKQRDAVIADFCNSKIIDVIFENGSSGWCHFYSNQLVYVNAGEIFNLNEELSERGKKGNALPQNDDEINAAAVSDFVKQVPSMLQQQTVIDDLGFTEDDYLQCKSDILKFKAFTEGKGKQKETTFEFNQNNIDFIRLISLVDSIKTISPYLLYQNLVQLSDMWSTTTNWTGLSLTNEAGQIMTIQCRYYEPNAFYFPWHISLEGINDFCTSMQINRFIKKVYPRFLNDNNKVAVLHTIVKRLY